MSKKHVLCILSALFSFFGYAQVNVTVDIEEQRFLNEVSDLDRTKFFVLHNGPTGDTDILNFVNENNVSFGRTGTADNSVRDVSRFVGTNHPGNVFRYDANLEDAANWAVEYWLDEVNAANRPEFWEPMNVESLSHASKTLFL